MELFFSKQFQKDYKKMKYRVILSVEKDCYVLLRVGAHDILNRI